MARQPIQHKVVFTPLGRPLTADEAAAIYGLTAAQLVRRILDNKDGALDRLSKGGRINDPY